MFLDVKNIPNNPYLMLFCYSPVPSMILDAQFNIVKSFLSYSSYLVSHSLETLGKLKLTLYDFSAHITKRGLEFHLMAFPVVKVYKRSFGLRALGLEILFGLQIRQKFKTKSEGMFSNNFFSALASLNYKARFITYF